MSKTSYKGAFVAASSLGKHTVLGLSAYHFRCFVPLDDDAAAQLDETDRLNGKALHQRGTANDVAKEVWRHATENELQPVLIDIPCSGDSWQWPSSGELRQWSKLGMLPPGKGGRKLTPHRMQTDWNIKNFGRCHRGDR